MGNWRDDDQVRIWAWQWLHAWADGMRFWRLPARWFLSYLDRQDWCVRLDHNWHQSLTRRGNARRGRADYCDIIVMRAQAPMWLDLFAHVEEDAADLELMDIETAISYILHFKRRLRSMVLWYIQPELRGLKTRRDQAHWGTNEWLSYIRNHRWWRE